MVRIRVIAALAVVALALTGCTTPTASPAPTPSETAAPVETPDPAAYHVPAPDVRLGLECADFGTEKEFSALVGTAVTARPEIQRQDSLYDGMPTGASTRQLGGRECTWDDGRPLYTPEGSPADHARVSITFVPDNKDMWDAETDYAPHTGTRDLYCDVSDDSTTTCAVGGLVGTTTYSIGIDGAGVGSTKKAAKAVAATLADAVESLITNAGATGSTWDPTYLDGPAECDDYLSSKAITKALDPVEPLVAQTYSEGGYLDTTPSEYARLDCYLMSATTDSFAGTMDVMPAGQWAWDELVALGQVDDARPVTVNGLVESDQALVSIEDDTDSTALDLIVGGNWVHLSVRPPAPGTITDDPETALVTLAERIVTVYRGGESQIVAAPPRSVPLPTTTVDLPQVAYEPAGGPNPTLDLTCESLATDSTISKVMGMPMGAYGATQDEYQRFGSIPWSAALRQQGGIDCLWSSQVPEYERRSEVNDHRVRIALLPNGKRAWLDWKGSQKGSTFTTCQPWAGTCNFNAYRNGTWVNVVVTAAISSVDFEKRLEPLFTQVADAAGSAAVVAQRWTAPDPVSPSVTYCTGLFGQSELKAVFETTKTVKSGTSFSFAWGSDIDFGGEGGPDEFTSCTFSRGHFGVLAVMTQYPTGSWAWSELGGLATGEGSARSIPVAGLRAGDSANVTCGEGTPAGAGDCVLNVILGGSWTQIELYRVPDEKDGPSYTRPRDEVLGAFAELIAAKAYAAG